MRSPGQVRHSQCGQRKSLPQDQEKGQAAKQVVGKEGEATFSSPTTTIPVIDLHLVATEVNGHGDRRGDRGGNVEKWET